ncbi:STAS domain-containing protein [Mycobacterium sp. 94-17]|uniref:STAS domain-containing protein n=1 Tax=Mycobacterium sp. 94-17 TaxID=2986147 RepID=UPI002D1F89E9|nr:STAS domain-containing protein [Mycobacterium sp. 94-17]MEB4211904.1 STAS domain-containing protein [Mycobacterium sp. 94-17]
MSPVAVEMRTDDAVAVLTVDGELDDAHSTALRERILLAALDDAAAVIVNVSGLKVHTPSAWSAFVGAYWQIGSVGHIPIVLACTNRAVREAITSSGLTHFMPVYSSEKAAFKALGQNSRRPVRRFEVQLPADLTSLRESRRLVREWLTIWSRPKLIPVALVVVNVFVENVLEHTHSVPAVRIEVQGTTATVAVSDASTAPAVRLPSPKQGIDVAGLAIVDALSRAWGSTPISSGKTVWAVIGPENQL